MRERREEKREKENRKGRERERKRERVREENKSIGNKYCYYWGTTTNVDRNERLVTLAFVM